MKNVIGLVFYIEAEDCFRSKELQKEFLKNMYDTYMEKEDTRGRYFSFEEVNKYIDLRKYCNKEKIEYDVNSDISIRHTFYRDASSKYARNNYLVDEWNKKTATFKNATKHNKEHLDNYINGKTDALTRSRAHTYVYRVGTEEDAALYEKAKIRNLQIGTNATLEDGENVYKLYKEYGLNGKEVDAYLKEHNLNINRKKKLISYYIENALGDKALEELQELNNNINSNYKEKYRVNNNKKLNNARNVISKLLNIDEEDLDIAIIKYNENDSLTKDELFNHLDNIRKSGIRNDESRNLYCKFMNAYRNNDEIVDNQILRLIPKANNNPEIAALEFLYDSKKTCRDGVDIIRGMVGNGIAGEWEVVPLKRALTQMAPKFNDSVVAQDEALLRINLTSNNITTNEEDKLQALKFIKDNNMEKTMLVYTTILRNINLGTINVYGETKEEIFNSPKKVKIK